jgi:hypothetical protein
MKTKSSHKKLDEKNVRKMKQIRIDRRRVGRGHTHALMMHQVFESTNSNREET